MKLKKIDLNAKLYKILNDIDDRRERGLKAASTGKHEPSSMYGGLYDVEEVDQGGDLIERQERGIVAAFVPVAELPHEAKFLELAPTGKKPVDQAPAAPIARRRDGRPSVLRRRRATPQASL